MDRIVVSSARYAALLVLLACRGASGWEPDLAASVPGPAVRLLVGDFCLECHDQTGKTANLDLESAVSRPVAEHADVWEHVIRKLRSRQMPPMDMPRPGESRYDAALDDIEGQLDQIAVARPMPGRTGTLRRLTRTEYQNAIRDLLALEVDASVLLPADESSHGFDNVTVGELSPTLLNRYVSASQKISRLAVGKSGASPGGDTIRVPADVTQEEHVPGLPIGTRGGLLIPYTFPQNGFYEIRVRLARDRNEEVEGLNGQHQVEVLLDRHQVASFVVKPPADGKDYSKVDEHLATRIQVEAGPHRVGVTFVKNASSLLETLRQPYQARFNMHRHPRVSPAVYQVSITGPYEATGPGDTPSRRRIFGEPGREATENMNDNNHASEDSGSRETHAKRILTTLARRAWRRPVTADDLARPMQFFRQAWTSGGLENGFEDGIEAALASLLVSPHFLFRIERDPPDVPAGTAYRISDLELASRLSFFLWSSIPDDELLELATQEKLHQPEILQRQVRRMLADERSRSLATNFAGQWLYLRNLDSAHPDNRLFPDFDDNLRQAMRRETELMFENILREDRSVLDLIRADHTYLNERLARHYGIPHIHGSRFRRVKLDSEDHRGGILRHGSILTVTSYATRTSPVIRGHWILKNLLGSPPPPPPANVPALKDNTVSATLPVRQRLAQHRKDPNCASCHNLMDPIGFPLENFDAVGRWRVLEAGRPVDATGGLPDGGEFGGVDGLEQGLLKRPELFVGTMTEKLLVYALGRGVEHYDGPAIRRIVRDARSEDYRLSTLVLGIVQSVPFQMRTAE